MLGLSVYTGRISWGNLFLSFSLQEPVRVMGMSDVSESVCGLFSVCILSGIVYMYELDTLSSEPPVLHLWCIKTTESKK